MSTLKQFKLDSGAERGIRGTSFNMGGLSPSIPFEEPTRDPTAWFNNSLRDPDVWPPPPPRDNDIWHQPTATSARNAKAAAAKRAEGNKPGAKNAKTATLGRKTARGNKPGPGKPDAGDRPKDEKSEGEKPEEPAEKRFDGSGYDGDLVEMLGNGTLLYCRAH